MSVLSRLTHCQNMTTGLSAFVIHSPTPSIISFIQQPNWECGNHYHFPLAHYV